MSIVVGENVILYALKIEFRERKKKQADYRMHFTLQHNDIIEDTTITGKCSANFST